MALPVTITFNRERMNDVLKRRFFYDQSFAIYGGMKGHFDLGPMGCGIKTNILHVWRQFFVLEEQMLEVDCSILTPERVLKASGHVDLFADFMVKDTETGDCFRCDHLIRDHLEKLCQEKSTTEELKKECQDICTKLDGMNKDELGSVLKKFSIKSQRTQNELTEPCEFNLMFSTQIGPTGLVKGFLRPETAQGIFVNFKRLLEFNQRKLPFAAAQIGNSFRNEISPRSGLIRMREFTLAEVEHFYDSNENKHPKFVNVSNHEMQLFSACDQIAGKGAQLIKIGNAVRNGLIASETLGYFMARISMFLLKIGILPERLRFRQHKENEKAHYAVDCWDAECLTSYGWIECAGCADRSTYDLQQHMRATSEKLTAEKMLATPKVVEVIKAVPNMQVLGKQFKTDAKIIKNLIENLSLGDIENMNRELVESKTFKIGDFTLTKDMISITKEKKTVHVEEITPSVIEPSFGISRIIYSLLEHQFHVRNDEDEQRSYFSLPPIVAPLKCAVLPLSNRKVFDDFVTRISTDLTRHNVSHRVDDSGSSLGKRFARADEIGIPYCITVNFDTLKGPHKVVLRERDSKLGLIIPLLEVISIVADLMLNLIEWKNIVEVYPKFEKQESTKI